MANKENKPLEVEESQKSNALYTFNDHLFNLGIQKVILVILENTNASDAFKQPFLSQFAQKGAYLSQYYGVTHPSQGNYIALISGNIHNVTDDSEVNLDQRHLGDLLEEAGKTWKVYAEDYPGNCFTGMTHQQYVRKHTPFISFNNVQKNPDRCKLIVPANQFEIDFNANALPNFSLFIPNNDNNGHDTSPQYSDHWFKNRFGKIIESTAFQKDTLLIVTFDEDAMTENNRIYTAFYGKGVKPSMTSHISHNHYSLLRTIEAIFQLPSLGFFDRDMKPINEIWLSEK